MSCKKILGKQNKNKKTTNKNPNNPKTWRGGGDKKAKTTERNKFSFWG